MTGPLTAAEMRGLERTAIESGGVTGLDLMERAGRGVVEAVFEEWPRLGRQRHKAVVFCGPGNNGGDGYGAARFLASWGRPVRVLRAASRAPEGDGDAVRSYRLAARETAVVDLWAAPEALPRVLEGADLVVDALFGVGLARDLAPPYPAWIEAVNAADALRLAVDVPSGLDADTGAARPVAVRADVTATMALPKAGLVTDEGRAFAGRVVEVDIGLPGAVHGAHRL